VTDAAAEPVGPFEEEASVVLRRWRAKAVAEPDRLEKLRKLRAKVAKQREARRWERT